MSRRLVLALALFASGCPGQDAARDAGDSTRSLVRVDLSYTRAGAELLFFAQAHFVRYRSFDPAGVPTILGFADFDAIPLDGCRISDGTAALDEALSADGMARGLPAEVALLDAGRLEVRGPIDRTTLLPKHYPEVVPFVSGMIYGGDDTHPVTLALGQSYQVAGEGGSEVGPFTAQVTSPSAFPQLTVEPWRRGADLDLRWTDLPESFEPLAVEVKWSWRGGSRTVRCRARDDGQLSIGREAFESLPPPTSASVSAVRVARGQVDAPGAGRGELTIELRDVVPLQVGSQP